MAYYLKWSPNSGDSATNNELLQINGVVGGINVAIEVAEDIPPSSSGNRYIFDGRRGFDSTTKTNINNGYTLQYNNGVVDTQQLSNEQINGQAVAGHEDLYNALANDVISFDAPTQLENTFAIGARFNEVDSFYGLTVKQITIIDDNGTHVINMSDSAGTGTQITSNTGTLTATLFRFPNDDSQWVFYQADPREEGKDYYLAWENDSQEFTSSTYTAPNSGSWYFETEIGDIDTTDAIANFLILNTAGYRFEVNVRDAARNVFYYISTPSGNAFRSGLISLSASTKYKVKTELNFDTNEIEIRLDDVVIHSEIHNFINEFKSVAFSLVRQGRFTQAKTYYLDINGERYYDPSINANDPLIIKDTIGDNDADLIGFANDNSQYVEYVADSGPSIPSTPINLDGLLRPMDTVIQPIIKNAIKKAS